MSSGLRRSQDNTTDQQMPPWVNSALTRKEIWLFAANPFYALSVVLYTPITAIECLRHIRARQANDPSGPEDHAIGPRERYPIWADVSAGEFTIVKRLPGHWVNGQQIQAAGRLRDVPGGTLIHLRLTERRLNAWLGVTMLAFLSVCTVGLVADTGSVAVGSLLIGGLVWAVFYALLTADRAFCFWLARNEPRWLIHFLRDTIQADVAEDIAAY
jgi:hypothetical protein